MKPTLAQLVAERTALEEQREHLRRWVACDDFCLVPPSEQVRAHKQLWVMKLHSDILRERIAYYEETPAVPV